MLKSMSAIACAIAVVPAALARGDENKVRVSLRHEEIEKIRSLACSGAKESQGTAKKLMEEAFGSLDRDVKGLDCSASDPLAGKDNPSLPLVRCSADGNEKLVLEPGIMNGSQVASACAVFPQRIGAWVVDLSFDDAARRLWSKYTADHVGRQVAVTVDSRVASHPVIEGTIEGSVEVDARFTKKSAAQWAESLGGCHV